MKVLVLGAGKMVEGILTGLKKGQNLSEWHIYSPSGTSAAKLAGRVGARFINDLALIKNPDWVLVGCKPQQLKELSSMLNGRFKESLFVSILAALTEEDQRTQLGAPYLIRCMPNLPVEFNEGVVLLASESAKSRLSSFQSLFSKLGTCLIVNEKELEELTLLTGSGPAFFYEFTKNLAESFESLSQEERETLARGVLRGAARSVSQGKKSLSELTDSVTSKGGVTIAVLEEWRKEGLLTLLKKGIAAGLKRTEEIKELIRS